MTSTAKPVNFYADFGGLTSLKGAAQNKDPKALRETARQFESLFTQMMLKSMRQASLSGGKGSMMDSDQSNFYRDMFDNQMAVQLAKGKGLGLADMLVRQLSQGSATLDDKAATISKASSLALPARSATLLIKDTTVKATSLSTTAQGVAPISDAEIQSMIDVIVGGNAQSAATSTEDTSTSSSTPAASTSDTPSALSDATASVVVAHAPPLASSREEFVKQLLPYAQAASRELGVDANTLIAHAALETGWGKFVPCNPDGTCSFNLFGIKANSQWKGDAVAVNTLEFEGGVAVKRSASFRAYDSPAESFRDYAALIKNNPRYSSAVGTGGNAAAFASALQQGGYATDPNYAAKLAAVADKLNTTFKSDASRPLAFGRRVSSGAST